LLCPLQKIFPRNKCAANGSSGPIDFAAVGRPASLVFDGHKSQLYFIESNGIAGRFKISWQEHIFSRDIHVRVHYEKNGKPGKVSGEDISAIIRFLGHIENLDNSFREQIASSLRKAV